MEDIIIINGAKKGNISVIMAGTHGNEICGVEAFKKIIPKLKIDSGVVYFVIANPQAVLINKRFVDFNLNRLFKLNNRYPKEIKNTYEYKRAQFIKRLLDHSEALLDIHSTTNKCEPFIICEKNAKNIVDYFPKSFKRIVHGFDAIEEGGTDGYMYRKGKIGICIECGEHNNPKSIINATNAIKVFLEKRGHITKKNLIKNKREVLMMDFLYKTKTDSFVLSKKFDDFTNIKKGELIGIDGKKDIISTQDSVIVFAHSVEKKGSEGFILGHKM